MKRREFLGAMAAFVAGLGLSPFATGCGRRLERNVLGDVPEAPALPEGVFQLGVASGDPLHDRVILWTRLCPEPDGDGGMPEERVPVIWEVFADRELSERVQAGWVWTGPEVAHAVHVDARGLQPSTTYWYRFRIGDEEISSTGRTRTFPHPEARPEKLRIATACCQKYRDGFYTAHRHLAEMELDAVFFLGDYIYESGGQTALAGRRPIDTDRVTDLAGFRARYAGYRSDEDLQASHAAHPWVVIWDDHEVSNNYAGFQLSEPRRNDGDPEEMRAAGYQAWYEHMPVRLPAFDDPAHMTIYRRFSFGDLATFFALDTRQYRDPQPCNDQIGWVCPELKEGELTILGAEQRSWLLEGLKESRTQWNLVVQQVFFSPVLMEFGLANPDQWDGYIDDRQALLDVLAQEEVKNPMVLSGDAHAAVFGELYAESSDQTSKTVAIEVMCTSISSGGDDPDGLALLAGAVENASESIHFFDASRRGFAVLEYSRQGCEVTYYAVATVSAPESEIYEAARFSVEAESLEIRILERF